jgi:glycine hydroxymethyltransferase
MQGGPLEHVIAAKAICFKEALSPEYKEYVGQLVKNAKVLASELVARGFKLVSGGTDNHLMLVDLQNKNITGKDAEHLLDAVNITCNKNAVPNDPQSPFVTSGIRLGTPAVTSRGMKEDDMKIIAEAIDICISDPNGDHSKALELVKGLTDKYPLYSK